MDGRDGRRRGGEEEGRWKARKATKRGGMEEMEGVAGPLPLHIVVNLGQATAQDREERRGY